MKFTTNNDTIISHVMLSNDKLCEQVAATSLWKLGGKLEAELTINGILYPAYLLEKVLQEMWEQCKVESGAELFKKRVKEEARRIVQDKAGDIMRSFGELQEKLEYMEDVVKWEWEE